MRIFLQFPRKEIKNAISPEKPIKVASAPLCVMDGVGVSFHWKICTKPLSKEPSNLIKDIHPSNLGLSIDRGFICLAETAMAGLEKYLRCECRDCELGST